jgi:hypothetical protein
MLISRLSLSRALLVIGGLWGASHTSAFEYTFDEHFFQPNTPIFGQGITGATFAGVDSLQYTILPGEGIDGSHALVVQDVDKDFGGLRINPTSMGLGGDFDAKSSRVEFAFSYRQTEIGGKGICVRMMMANDAVRLELTNEGRILAMDGRRHPEKTYVEPRHFTAEVARWVHVRGIIDFGTRTFTVTVNGAPLLNGTPMEFRRDTPAAGTELNLNLLAMEQTAPGWVPIQFDNLTLKLLPKE